MPKRKKRRKPTGAGRPVGLRFPAPQNPERVRQVIDLKDAGHSYEHVAQVIGISRVAVRLLYIRWKPDPWNAAAVG